MDRRKKQTLSLMLIAAVLSSVLMFSAMPPAEAQLPLPPGVPRGDVLVLENHWGTYPDPTDWNYKIPGKPATGGSGFQQLCGAYLWYVNTTSGKLIDWLAAGPPEYSADFKTVRFRLRAGAYWNDGKPFTADDVVFTIQTALNTKQWGTNAYATTWIESAVAEDARTVKITLKKAYTRFHYAFTVIIYGTGWWIVPKHVWEGKDPVSFKFYPPLSIGPYNLKAVDPAGNWFLWEREENWWGTKVLKLKPAPRYIIYIHHGPDEKKALAMIRHELEALRTLLPEAVEMVMKGNPYMIGWRRIAPYAWPFDACIKGVAFNNLRYPFNITEVRVALTHAMDYKELSAALTGVDGSVPTCSVLPVIRTPVVDDLYYKPLKDNLTALGMDPATGWWKYDTAKAESLLKGVGFTRGTDGKWRLPSGELWTFSLLTTSGFEMESQRIGFIVADQWKRFGIEVTAEPVVAGVWSPRISKGEYGVSTTWPGCSLLTDETPHIQGWATKYFDPLAPGTGWANYKFPRRAELDSIIAEMEATSPVDMDKLVTLGRKALMIWAEQRPWGGLFPTPFWTLQDTYNWEGWPSYPENYYMDPVSWWAQHMFVILKLYPTGRSPTTAPPYVSLWMTKAVPAFTGVDGKTYGPFTEGMFATIPKDDADRLIGEGKASYTMPPPAGLMEAVNATRTAVTTLSGTVTTLSRTVEELRGTVSAMSSLLYAIVGIQVIVLVVVIVVLVRTGKKPS